MSTVADYMTHARAFLGVDSNYASTEEIRMANTVNSIIGTYTKWHWNSAACTNVGLTANTSDYTMAVGDQSTVLAIEQGYLTDATTTYPPLSLENDILLPAVSTIGRPFALGLLSPTQVRLFPTSDGTYVLHWRKYKRPTVFTANTETWDLPAALDACIKQGMIWQLYTLQDDLRANDVGKNFMGLLQGIAETDKLTVGRRR